MANPVTIAISPSGAVLLAAQQVTNSAGTVVLNEVVTLGDAASGNVGSVLASGAQLIEPGGVNAQPVTGTFFPPTQTVTGTVTISSFPATQTVAVAAFPAVQTVTGAVTVAAFPAVQTVTGTVTIVEPYSLGQTTMAASVPVVLASNQSAGAFPATQTVTGTVTVGTGPATQTVAGTVVVAAEGSLAATAPTQAIYEGLLAATAYPTAVTGGQLVGAMGDKAGRMVAVMSAPRDLVSTATLAVTSTAAQFIPAGAAGVFQDIAHLIVTSSMTAAATFLLVDTAGPTTYTFNLAPNGGMVSAFPVPLKQGAAAASWTALLAAAGTVNALAIYVSNK
jgi:hypothetical protein